MHWQTQHGRPAAEGQKTTAPGMLRGTNMAGQQPRAPVLQLPACRDRLPSLLSAPAGTPFPTAHPPLQADAPGIPAEPPQPCSISRQPPPPSSNTAWPPHAPASPRRWHSTLSPSHHRHSMPPTWTPPAQPPPHRHRCPPRGFPGDPLTFSLGAAAAWQRSATALPLLSVTPAPLWPPGQGSTSPSTGSHPVTGMGCHHRPRLPPLGLLQPRPTAGGQQEQGAITRPPQCITSSPGLPHSPWPGANGVQTQRGGQRRQQVFIQSRT